MSFVALEKFNKQFENGGKRTVSELLRLEKEGRFAFYMPDADDVGADMLADRVGKCLPNICEIVSSPYVVLKSEYKQVRTELAAGLTPHGIRSTVKDPKLWKKKDGRLRPEFVYAKTNEDEYDIYENRMVKSLIDRVVRFLDAPMERAKSGVKNLYQSYFQSAALSKIDLVKLMDKDVFTTSDGRSFEDYKKLYYLRAKFSQLRSSAFYKIMSGCPSFAGQPEATNLFVHNKNYNACFCLWRFLDECGAGSLLSEDQIKSVYAAFISLAMIGIYVRFGFQIVNDVGIGRIDEDFSLQGYELENDLFKVIVSASVKKAEIVVQCKKTRTQQTTAINFHTDVSQLPSEEEHFTVSLYRTDYSDCAACVVPGNKNSLKDLESIVRCTVFTFETEPGIYDRMCLVCGSPMVENKKYFYQCEDCGAVYSFIEKNLVWLNRFSVLGKKDI